MPNTSFHRLHGRQKRHSIIPTKAFRNSSFSPQQQHQTSSIHHPHIPPIPSHLNRAPESQKPVCLFPFCAVIIDLPLLLTPIAPWVERDNRIRFFVINNRPNDALDLLERSVVGTPIHDPIAPHKVRYLKLPPASVCNKVLHSAAQTRDVDLIARAADLASSLQLQGVAIEQRTAITLIHGLAHTGQVDRGIQLLDSWLVANTDVLEEEDEGAQEGPHAVMTALLEAAAHTDDPDTIQQVLLRMAKVGYTPNTHTMTSLIQCFARLGHLNTANSMVQWMRRSEMEINAFHYAALMTLPQTLTPLIARQFLKHAKEAYQDLQSNNLTPTPTFISAYISVMGRLRDLEAARSAWLDMEEMEVEADVVCYTAMMDACAKGGDVEGAFYLYQQLMKHPELKPDAMVFGIILSAVHGSIDKARKVWSDLASKPDIHADAGTTALYVDALLRAGDSHTAMKVLQQQQQQGMLSESEVRGLYEKAIATVALKLQARLLRSLVKQMKEERVQCTVHMVSSILMARARKARGGSSRWRLSIDETGGQADRAARNTHTLRPLHNAWSIVESITTAVDAPLEEVDRLLQKHTSGTDNTNDDDALPIMIGWLSAEGKMQEAYALYDENKTSLDGMGMRAWALRLLMAGALAATPATESVGLVLQVMAASRDWSSDTKAGWWWDAKTQKQIIKLLKRSPEVAGTALASGVSGGGVVSQDQDAQLRRLVRK